MTMSADATTNPIYAVKLTMAELTASSVAWLSAADSVVAQLSEAVPLADWHPLEQLDLPAETTSERGQQRSPSAPLSRQKRQPETERTAPNLLSNAPSLRPKSAALSATSRRAELLRGQSNSLSPQQKSARSASQPQLSQLAQLAQLQTEETSTAPSLKRNRQAERQLGSATRSGATQLESLQNASSNLHSWPNQSPVFPEELSKEIDIPSESAASRRISDLMDAFAAQNAVDEVSVSPSLSAIDSIEQLTNQLLAKDNLPKNLSPRRSQFSTASRSAASHTDGIQSRSQTPSTPSTSPLSLSGSTRSDNSASESAFLNELQSLVRHPPSMSNPSPSAAESTHSVVNPIAANGFEVSPALSETLTDWVNDTLKEQAHRHGVDLS